MSLCFNLKFSGVKNVYHSGEMEVQHILGESMIAARNGTVIADKIVKGAINFIEKQPMAIVGSKNKPGELWASLLIGNFGFAKVPNPETIIFESNMITSNGNDVFYDNIQQHDHIGTLFIEPGSRRRFRTNGITSMLGSQIELKIKEAYPNCPKYIQRRSFSLPEHIEKNTPATVEGAALTETEINWIGHADTFFVSSTSMDGRLDVSHRGGNPNFVQVTEDGTLKIPDYSGNSLYNTLGNIIQNPQVGLLFVDFENGHTLQLTGKANLLFNQKNEDDLIKTKGTGRYWLFSTSRWIRTFNHHKAQWKFLEYSPFNP